MSSLVIEKGFKSTFFTPDQKKYINFTGGFGYQIPEIINAVINKSQLIGLSNRVLLSEPLISLCKLLASILPKLSMTYVCNSGDEAFEGALKLAKGLNPKAKKILYIDGGYYGALSFGQCMSNPKSNEELIRFLGIEFIPIKDESQLVSIKDWNNIMAVCHTGLIRDDTGHFKYIDHSLLNGLYKLSKHNKVPVVLMDVYTGLGQAGHMFSHHFYKVDPDVIVLGEVLGGGVIPIGTYSSTTKLVNKVYGKSSPAKHGSTTAGNPLACTAAIKAIQQIINKGLILSCYKNAKILTEYLDGYDIRQYGGILSLKLPDGIEAGNLWNSFIENGIYISKPINNIIIFICPLHITKNEINQAKKIIKDILDASIKKYEKTVA